MRAAACAPSASAGHASPASGPSPGCPAPAPTSLPTVALLGFRAPGRPAPSPLRMNPSVQLAGLQRACPGHRANIC